MCVFLDYFLNGNPTLVYGQFSILISLLISFQFSMLVSLLVPFQFSMLISLPVHFPFFVLSLALNRKFVKQSTTTRIMFEPSSGRKVENGMWEHFFTKPQTTKVDVVFTPLMARTLKTTSVAR